MQAPTETEARNHIRYLRGRAKYLFVLGNALAEPALKRPKGHPSRRRVCRSLEYITTLTDKLIAQADLYESWVEKGDPVTLAARYK